MNGQDENYWPDDLGTDDKETPLTVLKDQAAKLGRKTKNLVEASVETSGDSTGHFRHTLNLIIPTLPNYRYLLLCVYSIPALFPTVLPQLKWDNPSARISYDFERRSVHAQEDP